MASVESSPVEQLAAYVSEARLADVPAAVVEHAKLVLLDTVAVMLGGSMTPAPTRLAAVIAAQEPSSAATLLRPGFPCTTAAAAALVNATSGAFIEMDEGHRYFSTHAGIQVIPAALAMAEQLGRSGADLLMAVIVGYDAAARTGGATRPRREVNGHGTWATVGAAAACARLLGFDPALTAKALGLGAHLALATSFRAPMEGATIRNAYVGFAAQSGIRAAQLAQAGLTPLPDAPAEVFGKILGTDFSAGILSQALGQRFEIARNFMKVYACCQYNHAALDALEAVLAQEPQDAAEIAGIQVRTYYPASAMTTAAPVNSLHAKFSIPFAVATRLIHGHAGVDAFEEPALSDPRVRELAARVRLEEAPVMSQGFPINRAAEVRLRTMDGQERTAYCPNARGDFEQPYPREVFLDKARNLAGRVLTPPGVEALIQTSEQLDSLADVRQLLADLRKYDHLAASA